MAVGLVEGNGIANWQSIWGEAKMLWTFAMSDKLFFLSCGFSLRSAWFWCSPCWLGDVICSYSSSFYLLLTQLPAPFSLGTALAGDGFCVLFQFPLEACRFLLPQHLLPLHGVTLPAVNAVPGSVASPELHSCCWLWGNSEAAVPFSSPLWQYSWFCRLLSWPFSVVSFSD